MTTELKVILFTDQIDSTKHMAERTPAESLRITREQNDLTADAVRQCHGAILKDTGDGNMISFSSCADAVRCGFIIQQRVRERNAAQPSEPLKFALHVGIDLGEAVVLENDDLRANAANRAARVSAKGPEGEVYFTEKVKQELHPREAQVEFVEAMQLKGVADSVNIYRLVNWLGDIEAAPNPFIWRGGITKAEDFFDRDNEQRTLRSFLQNRQNSQIVGPRRLGKTSLLRQVERKAAEWEPSAAVAYVDLQDARCYTLAGWLRRVSRLFAWPAAATSLEEFAEGVDTMTTTGQRPVLCLDEFEELTMRRDEFPRGFFLALRSCGQSGLSIVTVSQRPLSELTEHGDPSSPFYNTFPPLMLGRFAEADAEDFVTIWRMGIAPFTGDEKRTILEFAKGHPLALQVACFHVIEERTNGGSLMTAMRKAADEMRNHLPYGW
jgi:class 3 adenylate cyclase